jgi:hypothetical protein
MTTTTTTKFMIVCALCATVWHPRAGIGALPPLRDGTIDLALEGDAESQAAVKAAELADVEGVDARLRPLVCPTAKELQASVGQLGDADPAARERGTAALGRISRAALPVLRGVLAETEDAEVRLRLASIVRGLERDKSGCVADRLLRGVYARHADALVAGRLKLVADDPTDWRALTFCRLSSFATTWGVVRARSEAEQLRFVLARIYTERASADAAEVLTKFPGPALLDMAGRTDWPVELQPPVRDGAYDWAMRAASLKGNQAECVLQISIDPGKNGGRGGDGGDGGGGTGRSRRWVHFNVFERMFYVWRNERPYLGSYEGMAYGVNRAAYDSLRPHVDFGFSRSLHVNRVPATLDLPVVRVGDAEQGDWSGGGTYEWARELFPAAYRDDLRFVPGRRTPAAVIVKRPSSSPKAH